MSQAPNTWPQGKARENGLRLYVARGTPNSNRAELNLGLAIERLGIAYKWLTFERVDVFAEPKRAIRDGIIVTPTLIAVTSGRRVVLMGDLSDNAELGLLLQSMTPAVAATAAPDELQGISDPGG